ncbi:UvrD-helicase domain-containing protein [Catenovulum sp. 2E275]|uniref:UvrD-helicase domain-containing protein n=1 Tax=Catenovulum sp. 2E275 TaxID=2980497 RepID=UPI0021D232FA|nr:UvrD-helicase domain-containing protein [Catenovulum sp. 2E275]MCU4677047.1 UvrD-helicase domain-containing protein [Catenovulum sp. 2E275]
MQLFQRKLYRFWQGLRGVKQQVLFNQQSIQVQFNQDASFISFAQLNQIELKKGWWFSQLILTNGQAHPLILKGYAFTQAEQFKFELIKSIINYYRQDKFWLGYLNLLKAIAAKQLYCSSYEWQPLLELQALAARFSNLNISPQQLDNPLAQQVFKLAAELNLTQLSAQGRAEYNQSVLPVLLTQYQAFFETVEKLPLTQAQRIACLTQDDHNLVIAGAGSGKTATLIGKAGYLLTAGLAKPEQILMLAFGQKAATEMNQRVAARLPAAANALKASTFHALGLDIINQVALLNPNMQKYKVSQLATNDSALKAFIVNWLTNQLKTNHQFIQQFVLYTDVADAKAISNQQIEQVSQQMSRFLGLFKESSLTFEQLKQKAKQTLTTQVQNGKSGQNTTAFITLFEPFFHAYQTELQQTVSLDFADMIALAIDYIEQGHYQVKFSHILVDEFQDLSASRAKLLTTLLAAHKNTRLFAVGDDWQAIYRFNGGDIRFFTEFKRIFSPASYVYLDKTFRFNQFIQAYSHNFIMKNNMQIDKKLETQSKVQKNPVHFLSLHLPSTSNLSEINEQYCQVLHERLTQLNELSQRQRIISSVLIIGRFSLNKMPMVFSHNLEFNQFPSLNIRYVTAHASKGLEADYAFIIGVETSIFPSIKFNEPIFETVLPSPECFKFAEERRLFYVALTRAKQAVFLIYREQLSSPFINELKNFDMV